MKLLIYSHFFAPSIGGVETVVQSLACGLAELRDSNGSPEFEITLVTQTPRGNFDDATLPFPVVRKPGFFHLWRLIRSSDVVHAAGPALAPLLLARLARKPLVIEHHGFQGVCPNGQLLIEPAGVPCPGHFMAGAHGECLRCNSGHGRLASWKLWLLTFPRRALCEHAAANVAPTQWLGQLLDLPRMTAIPHGIRPGPAVPSLARTSGSPIIVFLGRLVTTKGAPLLLKAAEILHADNRRFELLIVGDGPERAVLEQSVCNTEVASRVRFTGHLDRCELEQSLAQASAVVVPSLGGEVFGLVVAESMLRGLPVVASELGAFVEVLGGTGLTFRAGDPEDLASALGRLLDDPADGARLGRLARERALDFLNYERMLQFHAGVYRTALGT